MTFQRITEKDSNYKDLELDGSCGSTTESKGS